MTSTAKANELPSLVPTLAITLLLAARAPTQQPDWPVPPDAKPLPATCRRADSTKDDVVLPYLIRKVPLGDVSYYAKGGLQPDTFVRFSPDGRLLAIGTFLGRMKLLDVYSGKTLWDKEIAEGIVKQVDFSPDGKLVYFGEQSVDGFLYAADTETGKVRWRFRLADDLQTSAPPARDSLYGIYQLPGCYGLETLADGDLVVLGIHSWGDHADTGSMRRLSRVYRLSSQGGVRWKFPHDGPMPLTVIHSDCDSEGRRVALLAAYAGGNTPENSAYKPGSIYVLDGRTGALVGGHAFEPLKPHFEQVGFWKSVSVGPRGKLASVGMLDGRTFLFDLDTVEPTRSFTFGTPIVISRVPVSARSTYTHVAPDGMAYFQTSNSSVPYASSVRHAVAPPGPHPMANTIHAVASGGVAWRFRSGHEYQNFWTSADGRWLVTCVNRDDRRLGRDSGGMLFDTHRPGGGTAKFVYYYQVEGLTFFQADIALDGSAFAIVEVPYQDPGTGMLVGSYQVHVVR